MKKALLCLFFTIFALSVYAASLSATAEALPTAVNLTWSEVENTVYYDIYNGKDFVVRLNAASLDSLSYKVEKLLSNTSYSFSIASRDASNKTLAAVQVKVTTDSWDGVYKWENKTDKDNNGKLREIVVRIETAYDDKYGQYYNVYYRDGNGVESRIFPLFDFADQSAFEWHKYKEDSIAGNSYRTNAELFNTSPFKPGKWKVYSIVIDTNSTTAYIQTSAIGMEFLTTTVFELYLDESSSKHLSLDTKGEQKLVDNYLFKNPNPGEGDAFIFNKIS